MTDSEHNKPKAGDRPSQKPEAKERNQTAAEMPDEIPDPLPAIPDDSSQGGPDGQEEEQEAGQVLKVGNLGNEEERKAGRRRRNIFLVIAALLAALLLVLNSPLFDLKTIEISGNERVSSDQISQDLGLTKGTNLFRYAIKHINETPRVDPRLSTVDVYMKWPNGVKIVVEESQTIGYVYFQGTYLCIDRKGQVAASTNQPDQDLPVIEGIEVGSFSIGDSLNTKDAEKYDAVVTIGANLKKYELSTVVHTINVRSLDNILLKTDNLTVSCGPMTDMERKIGILAALLKQAPSLPKGTLHIEDINSSIYIEPYEENSQGTGTDLTNLVNDSSVTDQESSGSSETQGDSSGQDQSQVQDQSSQTQETTSP